MSSSIEEVLHNLRSENSQIRTELKAQQAVNSKLRRERDDTLELLQQAKEENGALCEELALRERMFQEICEQKEREVAKLMAIKEDLELRLHRALQVDEEETDRADICVNIKGGTEPGTDSWYIGPSIPHLPAQDVVEVLSKWDGMEDTITLFDEIIQREHGSEEWVPGSPWNSYWKFSIRLYLSCTIDAQNMLDVLLKNDIPHLQKQCKDGGCCLVPIHFHTSTLAQVPLAEDYLLSVCSSEVEKCDIFICLLGQSANERTKAEVEHGYLNNPLARPCIFLFLQGENSQDGEKFADIQRLRLRVKKAGNHARILECHHSKHNGLKWLSHEIQRVLKQDFVVLEAVQGDSVKMLERIGLLADMRVEWGQRQILQHYIQQAPPELFGVQTVYEQLDDYVDEEGPVPPLLLTGCPGLGKSTVLAKWIDKLSHSRDKNLILYHFVGCLGSCSADPGVIFRRLLKKMMYYCGEAGSIPVVPSQLMEYFMSYMEKLSVAQCGVVVIVIDNADIIQDCEQCLWWIVQPLPNNIRVVVTATEDNYPDSWRALPSPSIPTPTSQEMQNIVEFVLGDQNEALTLEQVGTLAVDGPSIPLWCVFASKHASSIRSDNPDELDEFIDALSAQQDIPELLHHILNELEASYSWMAHCMEQVLQLIFWSRNGILLTELQEIAAVPETLLILTICELERRALLSSAGGCLDLSHQEVQDAIQLKYSSLSLSENILHWTESLTTYFLKSPSSLMSRTAEEVPWLLQRADLKEELYHTLLNVDVLVQLYSSGHGGELLTYWKRLDESLNIMASQYYTSLRKIEENDDASPEYICSLFKTVGKVIGDLGFIDEALPLMQHYLELCEAHFDPDGVEVATSFTEIAGVYLQAGRCSAAEQYYSQALAIFEATTGATSPEVLKVVEGLITVHETLKHMDIARALSTRAYAIRDTQNVKNVPSNILKFRAAQLEKYCSALDDEVDVESAHRLNEYSVLLAVFGDPSLAEELFMRSWKVYETLFGESHLMVVRPLRNLAFFYMQRDNLEKATSLYERAHEVLMQNQVGPTEQMIDVTGKLATLYRQQNQMDLAEPFQIKFAELKEKELGPDHLIVAKALNNLAVMYSMQDDYENALPVYDRALRAYRSNYPEDHPTVITVIQNRQLAAHMLEQSVSKIVE